MVENEILAMVALERVKIDAISKGVVGVRVAQIVPSHGGSDYIGLVGEDAGRTRLLKWAVSIEGAKLLGVQAVCRLVV